MTDDRAVAERFADWAAGIEADQLPEAVRSAVETALIDHAGLCIAARGSDYVAAVLNAWDGTGGCTAFGHATGLDAAGAALVNGTAAHGEDYDDTFEGTPVHTGAVVIPAVLAACERYGLGGPDAFRGIAVGCELMCRLALVAPTAIHRAGFHPTAVIGALGAAAGVGAALRLAATDLANALGVAGSFASGIIEYLAEGAWTKRIHPGWAAPSGLRAALLGQHGFRGPRTVLEGTHGLFFAFGRPDIATDFGQVTDGLGSVWRMQKVAFKPYACGTMAQPFIDCAIRLARRGVVPAEIDDIVCEVGEGTVHRLWEPVAEKASPANPYAAKFSVPYCIAVAFLDRAAGFGQFTPARVQDPEVRALSAKIRYEIDPDNDYPRNYSGHVRARLKDGSVHEERQPHLRGGAREPLARAEILSKFRANAKFGGWNRARSDALEAFLATLAEQPDLSGLAAFRN